MSFPSGFILLLSTLVAFSAAAQEGTEAERYSGKQDQSWELIQTRLAAMKTKLDSQTALVNNLVAEKASLTDSNDVAAKNDELKLQHQKLETLVVEYNKLNEEYLTKFPERGLKQKRIYQRVKLKSIDAFEDDFTLRGRLNKLHGKVLRQYPSAVSKEVKKNNGPAKLPGEVNTTTDKKDVTETIELKK
jgi:hypothetical protein